MGDAANGTRYCLDCHLSVPIFRDHASGDTICTQCARVIERRYFDRYSVWQRADIGDMDGCGHAGNAADHAGNLTTTTIPDFASAGNTQYPKPSDNHTHGTKGTYQALPRMRGAKMHGAVLDKSLANHFLATNTSPHPALAAKAQSPEASDNNTHRAEGACLPLPRMHGAIDVAVLSRGGDMPKMRGAVLDKWQANHFLAANTSPYHASAGNMQSPVATVDHTHEAEGLELPRMCGAVGRATLRGAVLDKSQAGDFLSPTTIPYPSSAGNVQSTEASGNHTDESEGACLVLPRMRGAVGGAAVPSRRVAPATPKMRGAVLDGNAFLSIDDMAARLGVAAAVTNRAKEVFSKLEYAKTFPKSRNRHALYAACLHVAGRAVGTPRTLKELASVTGDTAATRIKDIGRLVKHIKSHLGEDAVGGQAAVGETVTVRAVRRFGSLVGIGDQEVNMALEAVRRLEKNLDVRRCPDSIAATVIYMALHRAGAGKSFRDVSTATGVSKLTIKDVYYRDLSPHSKLLFD